MEGQILKVLMILIPTLLLGQAQFRKVDTQFTHDRVLAIVPIVGAGNAKSPKRPQFTDLPGITGFTAELSDDGKFALVEFVVKDPKLLTPLLASGQRTESKDKSTKNSLYEDFKRYKKDFKPERFGLTVP